MIIKLTVKGTSANSIHTEKNVFNGWDYPQLMNLKEGDTLYLTTIKPKEILACPECGSEDILFNNHPVKYSANAVWHYGHCNKCDWTCEDKKTEEEVKNLFRQK